MTIRTFVCCKVPSDLEIESIKRQAKFFATLVPLLSFVAHRTYYYSKSYKYIAKGIMTAPKEDQTANNRASQGQQEDEAADAPPAQETMQLGAVPLVQLLRGGLGHDLSGEEEIHQTDQNVMNPMQLLAVLEDILDQLPEEDF